MLARHHAGKCALRFLKHLLQTAIAESMPSYCPGPSGHFSTAEASDGGGLNCGPLPPLATLRNEPRLLTAAAAMFMGSAVEGEAGNPDARSPDERSASDGHTIGEREGGTCCCESGAAHATSGNCGKKVECAAPSLRAAEHAENGGERGETLSAGLVGDIDMPGRAKPVCCLQFARAGAG